MSAFRPRASARARRVSGRVPLRRVLQGLRNPLVSLRGEMLTIMDASTSIVTAGDCMCRQRQSQHASPAWLQLASQHYCGDVMWLKRRKRKSTAVAALCTTCLGAPTGRCHVTRTTLFCTKSAFYALRFKTTKVHAVNIQSQSL